MTRYVRSCFVAAAALAMFPAWALAQQGTITGHVTDAATKAPIPSVQVTIVGTHRGAVTDAQGEYRIGSVQPGALRVRAQRIGFDAVETSVTITGSETETADFALNARAVSLDATVVLANAQTQRVRESGVLTGKVEVDSLNKAAIDNASDMLQSRVPGVTVTASGGTVGGNSKIRIRGSSSISLSNDPLIIVDGIRVNSDLGDGNNGAIGVGGQAASRFNDLNPEDIENIEVVKGPAASSLYGTAAANGVIYITTKRGTSGKARWSAHVEGGTNRDQTNWPANLAAIDVTAAGDTLGCDNPSAASGACTQNGLLSWNPLVQASPFTTGNSQNYGLSVSGGGDRAQYYLSGNFDRQLGILAWNVQRHFDLRANVTAQPRDNMNITTSVGYVQSRLRLPQNDNNILGVLGGGLLGNVVDDAARGYLAGQTPQQISAISTHQNVDRFTSSVTGSWLVIPWLNLNATAGLDFTNNSNQELIQPNLVFFADFPLGQRTSQPFQTFEYTMQGGATATFNLTPDIKSVSTGGVDYNNETIRGTIAFGKQLLAGTGSLNAATAQFAVGEVNTGDITLGAYGSEQLSWKDRVFVTGGLRGDENSAFGLNNTKIYYPSGSLSWVIGEEPWFPKTDAFSSLRVRVAYGESGRQPGFRDAITFFNPVAVISQRGEEAAFTPGGVGNTNLKAERSKEIETGFDVGLLNERASLSFTYYRKHTDDLLIRVPLPPSQGQALSIFKNLGSVQNQGVEGLINANILTKDPVQWTLGVNVSSNHNKILNLGQGITPILFGADNAQRHQNGYAAGSYFQRPYTFKDANGDGKIDFSEVTLGDTAVNLGTPFPTLQSTFTTQLTLFKYFRINGQLDYEGGQKLLNFTEDFRCKFDICAAANDPKASLASQAANIAQLEGSDAGFIEPATFWKLREVSLTLLAPESIARRAGASALSLTVAGRNLHTWTKYKGFDPELNENATGNFSADDFLTLPPLRIYTLRVDVTW
ncbi:MAG TPA: SusC/RagA family TonB-linked outer membrane protein [Vicinamibacterales bacterium]|nr:SusC/RagA family TonB-linked outer membrane protein [Vicinamibacterales bacterium]